MRELCIRGECRDAWVTVDRIWFCPAQVVWLGSPSPQESLTRLTNMIVEVMRTNTCRMENAGRCRAQRHMDYRFHRAGRIAGTDTPHLPENGNTGNTDFFVPLRNTVRIGRMVGFGFLYWADLMIRGIASSGFLCYRGFAEAGAGGLAVWPRAPLSI